MIRAALVASLAALPAAAQTLPDRDAARALLFEADGSEIVVIAHDFLSELDIETLGQMPQVAQLKYYGALAAAPALGLQAEASRGAFNYHSPERARAGALAECDAVRGGGPACVIVAEIRPRGWQDGRALTLSQDATEAVTTRAFRRAGPSPVLAISPSTGAWGLGDGAAAAVAACGQADCAPAVAE
ncbi:MAG: 5-aminolevulic acid synthase [Pseudomonadota bacterium]